MVAILETEVSSATQGVYRVSGLKTDGAQASVPNMEAQKESVVVARYVEGVLRSIRQRLPSDAEIEIVGDFHLRIPLPKGVSQEKGAMHVANCYANSPIPATIGLPRFSFFIPAE